MPTILVTGASGTVGREVAKRLAEQGAPARLAFRDPSRGVEGAEALERVRFDFHDPSGFAEALRGVDRVFLLRPPQLADIRRDFDPFLLAMMRAEVERVVFLSVRGAERNPLLPHRRIERALERSGLAWTHLRPNDWMQNFATVHRDDIRDRGEIWAPAGKGRTSFVDARDVAEAAAAVLTGQGHDRRAYPLTGGEELDLHEVAAVLSEVLGRRVAYRNPGVVAFLRHARRRPPPRSGPCDDGGLHGRAARFGGRRFARTGAAHRPPADRVPLLRRGPRRRVAALTPRRTGPIARA